MNDVYRELAATLEERLTIIGDEHSRQNPDAHLQRLQKISERLEKIEQRLPRETDPQLRHFLERRSYSKALELLRAMA